MPRRTLASIDGIKLADMSASAAETIEERIDPIVRRCVKEHDPHTLLYDLARCVYVAGLTDGVQLRDSHGVELAEAVRLRDEGESHVEETRSDR